MTDRQGPSVRWPQYLLLALMLVLGMSVPITWHRRHDQHASRTPLVLAPSAPGAPMPLLAGGTLLAPTEIVAADKPLPGLEAVPPSSAAFPGSPFASLVVDNSAAILPPTEVPPSDTSTIHRFRRGAEIQDAAPVFSARAWPLPEALDERLAVLRGHPQTRDWSNRVQTALHNLSLVSDIGHEQAGERLDQLQATIRAAEDIASEIEDGNAGYHLSGAAYDVARRVEVWPAAHELAATSDSAFSGSSLPFGDVAFASDSSHGQRVTVGAVDVTGILAGIEQYEFTRLGHDGAKIAAAIRQLENSGDEQQRQLADTLDCHYRNANIRIATSGDLFNRMIPQPQVQAAKVDDFLMGVPVFGRSVTRTRLYARLIPDPNRIRIGMEAWGSVWSDTTATSGPAQIVNQAETAFLVRKLILVDHDGVKTKPTVASSFSENDLVDISTSFDGIPLLGALIRNIARRQADVRESEAMAVTEQKVTGIARQRFDQEINPRLNKAISEFKAELWTPLVRLGLEPTVVGLSSSERRAVSRLRVGNGDQVAAHNARPRALSDSVISMQLHESAMNNALAQFALDGQTLNLHDLYLRIAGKLEREVDEVPETMAANVVIGFAPRDAIRVRCEDDMVRLTLALTKVSKGSKYNWSNLIVRANYQIELDGMQANLVRTGSIELAGKRLRTGDQIALRGVFSKLLSRSSKVQLVPDKLVSDPRLADLQVTQRVIDEGWIGIAIGPKRPTVPLSADRTVEVPPAG